MTSHALIYYTHFVSDVVKSELGRLQSSLPPEFEVFAVGCCETSTALDELETSSVRPKAYLKEDLRALPYPNQLAKVDWVTLRRNPDLAIMRFFRGNPDYDFYWIVEYDVRFTGDWGLLLAELSGSSADLLCIHLTTKNQNPGWMHWESFGSGSDQLTETQLIRAFLPFCRLSKALLRGIDERCRRGWQGHPEALWPTVANNVGLLIEEIGGHGSFVPISRVGRFYDSHTTKLGVFLSTFAAWPSYSVKSNFYKSSPPDILWHPVKE